MKPDAPLIAAVQAGDQEACAERLRARPEAAKSRKPILEAALYGRPEIIRLLLEHGADPNAASPSEARYRPLHRAIEPKAAMPRTDGHRQAVDVLLEGGADPDQAGCWYDGRPLETAARAADRWAAETLLRTGARQDLAAAALIGDLALATSELDRDPAAAARPSESGAGPLHLLAASRLERPDVMAIAERLLAAGARADAVARMRHRSFPVIHFACYRPGCPPQLVDRLIAEGADPQDGLYESLWAGDYGTAARLVAHGADVNGRWVGSGRPLLHEMLHWGRNPAAQWLLARGADPGATDEAGRSALAVALGRKAPASILEALQAAQPPRGDLAARA